MLPFLRSLVVTLCLLAVARGAAPIRHEFVAIDEGKVTLMRIDENDPRRNWVKPVGRPLPRDLQLIGGGRLLVGHDAGFSEFDLSSGQLLREVTGYRGVTSARRRPDGHTVLTGVNLEGATGIVLLELGPDDRVRRRVVLPGTYVRLVRDTPRDTRLLVCNATIREVKADGTELHAWTVPGFRNGWKAVSLPGGRVLASAGYGAFLVELDAEGRELRRFGEASPALAAARPHFYATFQRLANGDVVVANWQGHGPGHGASGWQLLQFDGEGRLVWHWSDAALISSLQGVLVLDGLDPAVLHDERDGVVAPVQER